MGGGVKIAAKKFNQKTLRKRLTLKSIINKVTAETFPLAPVQVGGSCEHSIEPSSSIRAGIFLFNHKLNMKICY
jgi:hypothetical protein